MLLGAFTPKAPTSMEKAGVRAAVWLAMESIPLFPCFCKSGRFAVRGFQVEPRNRWWFQWPLWSGFIPLRMAPTVLAWTAWKAGCSRVRAGCSRYSAANSSSPISTCRASNPPSVYGNRNLIGLHADDAHPLLWTYDGSPIHGRCRGVIDSRGHSFIAAFIRQSGGGGGGLDDVFGGP